MLSSPPSLSPSLLFCREKEDPGPFLPHLQRARSPACSKLQRLPSMQRFSHDIVQMCWEEPELQDQPVCKQLCLFCSGVSEFLWAQFPHYLAPKPFTWDICPFPHTEKDHGLLCSLCGPWGCLGGRWPTCQNHLAQNSPAVLLCYLRAHALLLELVPVLTCQGFHFG